MHVVNSQLIRQAAATPGQTGKFILNGSAIIFFPTAQQHNSIKSHGLTYEDDYRGNAMAGTFGAGRIDIRFHRDFSDEHVRTIWTQVLAQSELAVLNNWAVFYQGRKL
jgi:hypothetical protein